MVLSYVQSPLKRGGFSCFSDTPIERPWGRGTGDGGGVFIGPDGSANFGPSGSS